MITIDDMKNVPLLQGLSDAIYEKLLKIAHEKNLKAQAFWRGTGWEYCAWVQYHYREFDAES